MTTPTDLPSAFRRAIEVIRERGWFHDEHLTNPYQERGSHVDVLDAIAIAVQGFRFSHGPEVVGALLVFIDANGLAGRDQWERVGFRREPEAAVGPWNNAPDRTVDDVLDALERAAVAAESGGAA